MEWKEKQQKKPRSNAQRGFSICLPLLTAYGFDKNNAFLPINKKTPEQCSTGLTQINTKSITKI
jgi:hypothetical protein